MITVNNRETLFGQSNQILFTMRIEDLDMKKVVTVEDKTSITEAAKIMTNHKISSLIITDKNKRPVGIVTDRDLREKVVASGKDVSEPVKNIMSSPLIWIEPRAFCFEAILKMLHHNVHHIAIMKNNVLKGIITNHDLMVIQGSSPLSLVKEIEKEETIEGLFNQQKNINQIISIFLKEGVRASNITSIITEINDRLVIKLLDLTEKKMGEPPLKYCWIVFGSEGRKEQTFKTDQDNALIYEDPKTDDESKIAESYFEKFSLTMKDNLLKCGFPPCPGNYMASNPKWRQPLKVWKNYFSNWILTPTSDALLASCIIFDFRPVYGDFSLAEKIKEHLRQKLRGNDMFLKLMAQLTIQMRPPISFFKKFILEKSGQHKNKLNIKNSCIAPLINIVRLFSLENRIADTSTIERLENLKTNHSTVKEFGEELKHAFEFLSLLRIRHQFNQIKQGEEPDNFIDPLELNNFERKVFKESCQLIRKMQEIINKKYNPGTGSML